MSVTPQSNATLAEIAVRMRELDDFCICGHVSPDGDCLGSALALGIALEGIGKRVTYALAKDDPIDAGLRSLPRFDSYVPAVQLVDEETGAPRRFGCFVAVDVPSPARMGEDAACLHARATVTFTLDHHAAPERVSDFAYVDPDSASASLIIWELAGLLGPRGADLAQCAYVGLMTDTGSFRYQNADARAFALASEMVEAGADPARAARDLFQNRSLASLRLESIAISRMRFCADGMGVISWLGADDFASVSGTKADAEPIINALRSIAGIKVACMLREQDDAVRASLRAKDDVDVSVIARAHGGGGHVAAAGFTFESSLRDAVECAVEDIERLLGSKGAGCR